MMLKRLLVCGAVVLACSALPSIAGGNANFLLGSRALDEDDWEPLEEQVMAGVTVDFGREGWPIHLAIGLHGSDDEEDITDPLFGDAELTATLTELSFGVLKSWSPGSRVRPFVGGGLTAVTADLELEDSGVTMSADDTIIGVYGHGGVYWRLGSRFNIGLDARVVSGDDFEIEGVELASAYGQLGLLLGWGWPAED